MWQTKKGEEKRRRETGTAWYEKKDGEKWDQETQKHIRVGAQRVQ